MACESSRVSQANINFFCVCVCCWGKLLGSIRSRPRGQVSEVLNFFFLSLSSLGLYAGPRGDEGGGTRKISSAFSLTFTRSLPVPYVTDHGNDS
jgi:hypothetical protein